MNTAKPRRSTTARRRARFRIEVRSRAAATRQASRGRAAGAGRGGLLGDHVAPYRSCRHAGSRSRSCSWGAPSRDLVRTPPPSAGCSHPVTFTRPVGAGGAAAGRRPAADHQHRRAVRAGAPQTDRCHHPEARRPSCTRSRRTASLWQPAPVNGPVDPPRRRGRAVRAHHILKWTERRGPGRAPGPRAAVPDVVLPEPEKHGGRRRHDRQQVQADHKRREERAEHAHDGTFPRSRAAPRRRLAGMSGDPLVPREPRLSADLEPAEAAPEHETAVESVEVGPLDLAGRTFEPSTRPAPGSRGPGLPGRAGAGAASTTAC